MLVWLSRPYQREGKKQTGLVSANLWRVGAVQALPVHPLEQVWHGDAWAAGPVYTLDAPPQGREGLAVTLSPPPP